MKGKETEMKKMVFVTAMLVSLFCVSTAFAGLKNSFAKVFKDGAWATSSDITAFSNGFYIWDLPRTGVEGAAVWVACENCTLYNNTASNWYFWEPDSNAWDTSIDFGGYRSTIGNVNYYRGEEDNELTNETYDYKEKLMKFKWGYTSPGTQAQWIYYYAPLIVII